MAIIIGGITAIAGVVGVGLAIKKEADSHPSPAKASTTDFTSAAMEAAAGQADAIVVDAVNAVRISQLLKCLSKIDRNQAGAEEEIRKLKEEVAKLLISNRGGKKGIHGFIGETSQVHIANIKAFINGDEPLYILLDDNSMTDYLRGIEIIQQKACQAGGKLGLDAIKRHAEKHPEFIDQRGIYQIPRDMYEKYDWLRNLPEEAALKLRRQDLRLWKYIKTFTDENPNITIEPMELSYPDIQVGNIDATIKRVEDETDQAFEEQRKDAHDTYSPNLREFLKVCAISAVIEGCVSAAAEVIQKIKNGKKLNEFTRKDLQDILKKLVIGNGIGAIRGGIVYGATNILKFSATIASGIVTGLFAVSNEAYLYFKKKITGQQMVKNSVFSVIEIVASVAGAAMGKRIIKNHPIIGAIAGSTLGSSTVAFIRKTAFA